MREYPPLPRGGVRQRFSVERIDERHRETFDTIGGFPRRFRWALLFEEGGEVHGFETIVDFKTYCRERWGVTEWSRSERDWSPEDGDSWVASDGEFWPGRRDA